MLTSTHLHWVQLTMDSCCLMRSWLAALRSRTTLSYWSACMMHIRTLWQYSSVKKETSRVMSTLKRFSRQISAEGPTKLRQGWWLKKSSLFSMRWAKVPYYGRTSSIHDSSLLWRIYLRWKRLLKKSRLLKMKHLGKIHPSHSSLSRTSCQERFSLQERCGSCRCNIRR